MRRRLCTTFAYIFILTLALTGAQVTHAATFNVGCGDVAGLIAAITTANSNGEADVIELAAGCTYTLTAVNHIANGPNGLPAITQPLTINGNGAIIERDSAAPEFRIMRVADGSVTLRDLTLRKGHATSAEWGGNLYADGTVILINTTISEGIAGAGGGIRNDSSLIVVNSTISGNRALNAQGGGIVNTGGSNLTVINSLISGNETAGPGGGIDNSGIVAVYNSTISGNTSANGGSGIDSAVFGTTLTVKNSVIWGNNDQQISVAPTMTLDVEYNGIQGSFAGIGNLNLSASAPVFVNPRPADEAPTTAGNYHLSGISPVIDMGSNTARPQPTLTILTATATPPNHCRSTWAIRPASKTARSIWARMRR